MSLIFLQTPEFSWWQLALWGPTIIILVIVLAFLLRVLPTWLPTWKELKLRELDVREKEATAKSDQAASLAKQAEALGELGAGIIQMSSTLKEIAIEQRRATDGVKLLQRVNADIANNESQALLILEDRINRLERERIHGGSEETRAEAH